MSFIDDVYKTNLQEELAAEERARDDRRARREAREYIELIKNQITWVHGIRNERHFEAYLSSVYDNMKLDDKGKCFKKNYAELLSYYISQELAALGLRDFQVIFDEIPQFEEKGIIFKKKVRNYKYGLKIYIILDW